MKLKATLSVLALLTAQAASASSLSLSYNGSAAGYEVVSIDLAPITVIGNSSNVYAGGFEMTDSSSGGLGDFVAWCLDLGAWLGTSGTFGYETTTNPFQNGGQVLDVAAQSRISAVFNANFGSSVTSTSENSAAFQLALWESVYDDDLNISTGDFRASGPSAVETIAAGYLSAAGSYSGANLFGLTYLESTSSPRRQNLVTAVATPPGGPTPVPLPAGGLLLLTGLFGVAGLKRKKRTS